MTLEERVCRTVNRLAVVERLLELEGLEAADNREHEDAVRAGLHALIVASYEDLEPIEHAPPPRSRAGSRTGTRRAATQHRQRRADARTSGASGAASRRRRSRVATEVVWVTEWHKTRKPRSRARVGRDGVRLAAFIPG